MALLRTQPFHCKMGKKNEIFGCGKPSSSRFQLDLFYRAEEERSVSVWFAVDAVQNGKTASSIAPKTSALRRRR